MCGGGGCVRARIISLEDAGGDQRPPGGSTGRNMTMMPVASTMQRRCVKIGHADDEVVAEDIAAGNAVFGVRLISCSHIGI